MPKASEVWDKPTRNILDALVDVTLEGYAPEPGTSVIRWTRFVNSETAPHYGISILVIQKCSPKYVSFDGGMQHELDYGDLWSYLPEPPEAMK